MLSDRLQITHPIIQAPIGSATTAELAAAVSNAGGLGSLAITWRSTPEIAAVCRRTIELTSRPFAANIVLAWPAADRLRAALDAGVRIISTFWGDPAEVVGAVHAAGATLMHIVGSVEEAASAIAAGVDVVVLQGVQAGGHVRGVDRWQAMLPSLLATAGDVPIVVAGGIATAADVTDAIARGASGVMLGTRFVCSLEANAAPVYQQAIVDARAADTVHATIFDKGWPDAPHRAIRNSTVRAWERAGRPAPGQRPGEHDQIAVRGPRHIERYSDDIPTRETTGDLEALALYAGESCDGIDDVLPAAEIVRRLIS